MAALVATALSFGTAQAQSRFAFNSPAAPQYAPIEQNDQAEDAQLDPRLQRQIVNYASNEAPGTVIIDTPHTLLYFVLVQFTPVGVRLRQTKNRRQIDRAAELTKSKGIKRAMMLPVSAPFHSPLMKPAAREMEDALANAMVKPPRVPVISNVTVEPTSDPDRGILSTHLHSDGASAEQLAMYNPGTHGNDFRDGGKCD